MFGALFVAKRVLSVSMAIDRVTRDVTYTLANAELAAVLRGRVVALPE